MQEKGLIVASIIKADTLQSTTSNVFVLNSAGTEYARFDSSGNLQLAGAFSSGTFSANGNVTLSAANTKILNSSGNPILQQTGSVLQVVQGTTTTQVSTTSTSFITTGLSASITPLSSTSKILVLISMGDVGAQNAGSGTNGAGFALYKNGSSLVGSMASQISYNSVSSSGLTIGGFSSAYLDSPATTSSTTYAVYYKTAGAASTMYIFRDNTLGVITLMEIAG